MYAIIRKDLDMPPGKLASQAGHAFTDSLSAALDQDPDRYHNYRQGGGGSKVVLKAKSDLQLINTYNRILELGIPCAMIVDQKHVMPPHFDGSPVITALGIGPCYRDEVHQIVKKYGCV
jgi:peptidyl-tRNA hydrolase